MTEVRGFPIGPVDAKGAFTADFASPSTIDSQTLANVLESDRRQMDVRPGMRNKYTPLRYDPATGEQLMGGRYLFDTYENALDYDRWTSEEFGDEPGTRFWDRFAELEKHVWKVVGAEDFKPMAHAHHIVRFERYTSSAKDLQEQLTRRWPSLRTQAERENRSSVWLLVKPAEGLVGIVSVAGKVVTDNPAEAASRGLAALEGLPALGAVLSGGLAVTQVFDRTSVNFNSWLPASRALGGTEATFEVSPPHASPVV